MGVVTIIAALAAGGLGWLIKALVIRKWAWLYVTPKSVAFPPLCPICLSPADATVEEASSKRQTATYVIAQKLEWWRATVPHCSECTRRLSRNRVLGLVAGGICIVAAFMAAPPSKLSAVTFCYLLFGYPAYALITTIQKGIVLGHADSSGLLLVHVRKNEYLKKLAALNASVSNGHTNKHNTGGF